MKLDDMPEMKYQKLIEFLDKHKDEIFSANEIEKSGFNIPLKNTAVVIFHIGEERVYYNPKTRKRWFGCPAIIEEYKKRIKHDEN